MKNQNLYDEWKAKRSQIGVGEDFAEKVMHHVYQYECKKSKPFLDTQMLILAISSHPLVQAVMIAIGAIIGFVRLILMLHVMLYA